MQKFINHLAIGHMAYNFKTKTHEDYLTVQGRKGVFRLTQQEEALWSVLCHGPLGPIQMEAKYNTMIDRSDIREDTSVDHCLRHLRKLGLVVSGEGDFPLEARYNAMRDVLVVPFPETLPKRVHVAAHLLARRSASFNDVKAMFPHRRPTELETEILTLVSHAPLTVAQLIMLVECKTWSAETVGSVIECLKQDGRSAMNTYAEMMYASSDMERVLDAVTALRQDRKIACL